MDRDPLPPAPPTTSRRGAKPVARPPAHPPLPGRPPPPQRTPTPMSPRPAPPRTPSPPARSVPRPPPHVPAAPPLAPAPAPSDNPWKNPWLPFMAAAVPVSSLLGLLRLMRTDGVGAFPSTWATNLWADLIFVAGTMAAFWVSAWLASGRGRPTVWTFLAGVGAGLGLHAIVYLAGAFLWAEATSVFGIHFAAVRASDVVDVLLGGIAGLVGMAFAGPLVGLFFPRGRASGTAPTATK